MFGKSVPSAERKKNGPVQQLKGMMTFNLHHNSVSEPILPVFYYLTC